MRSQEGLILLADEGSVLWANEEAADLLGYSQDELHQMALPVVAVYGDISLKPIGPIASAFKSLLTGEEAKAEGDARLPTKGNNRVAVHWKLWSLPPAQAGKQILLAISETAQASAEGPVVSGYRDVFEYAVEGIFRTTIDGKCIEVNPALARMHGYSSPAEFVASVNDIANQLYVRPDRRAEFVQVLLEHGSVAGFEAEVYRADGTIMWVATFARVVLSANFEPLYFEGSLIDITERKETEAALKRSEEQLRELAARNHEIREEERMKIAREIHDELGQALTLLRIDLSWLNGRLADVIDGELRKPLEQKIGEMEQMIHWTLQAVRRILSTLRPPLLDESGLKDAIEFHLDDFAKRAALRYEIEVAPMSPIQVNTATAIFRIFQEILTNIARHAKASRVKVHLSKSNSDLILKVHDNGRGISRGDLKGLKSFGLLGMQERASAIGGEVEIVGSPRSGTTITLKVPIPKNGADE